MAHSQAQPPPPPVPPPMSLPETEHTVWLTVWHYRYFNISPRRPEAELLLRSDKKVRLLTDIDSGWMDSWGIFNGDLRIIFHYAGEGATIRRNCEFYMPQGTGIFISNSVYPVVMVYSHQSRMTAPAPTPQQPPGLPVGAEDVADRYTDEECADRLSALRISSRPLVRM